MAFSVRGSTLRSSGMRGSFWLRPSLCLGRPPCPAASSAARGKGEAGEAGRVRTGPDALARRVDGETLAATDAVRHALSSRRTPSASSARRIPFSRVAAASVPLHAEPASASSSCFTWNSFVATGEWFRHKHPSHQALARSTSKARSRKLEIRYRAPLGAMSRMRRGRAGSSETSNCRCSVPSLKRIACEKLILSPFRSRARHRLGCVCELRVEVFARRVMGRNRAHEEPAHCWRPSSVAVRRGRSVRPAQAGRMRGRGQATRLSPSCL